MTAFSYFISGNPDQGYWWTLARPDGDDVCSSSAYRDKAECLQALRAAQQHAATTDLHDESE